MPKGSIEINKLKVYAYHGVLDQENRIVVQFMRGELFCKTIQGGKLIHEH